MSRKFLSERFMTAESVQWPASKCFRCFQQLEGARGGGCLLRDAKVAKRMLFA